MQLQELVPILSTNPAVMWKQLVSGYFTFTKKERTGIMVIIGMVSLLLILPETYDYFIPEKIYDDPEFEKAVASLMIREADSTDEPKPVKTCRLSSPLRTLNYFTLIPTQPR